MATMTRERGCSAPTTGLVVRKYSVRAVFRAYLERFVKISRRSAYDLSRDDLACAQSASNDPGRHPQSRLAGVAGMRPRAQLAAENLFLRKQLALYMARRVKPRRADDATRIILVGLSRILDSLSAHRRQTRDAHPLTSKGIPVVLALEIAGTAPPADSSGPVTAH